MAYENIRLRKRNVVMVDGYFYMMDDNVDSLLVKTDDGTQAFTYPLDTVIENEVVSLEYDGRNFWTLENLAGNDIRIRRWYLYNHVCRLRNTFNFVESGSHKYDSNAFTVEHYHIKFSSFEDVGESTLSISDGSKLDSGLTVTLGPSTATGYEGRIEEFSVQSAGSDWVAINGTTTCAYNSDDPICFYKRIWVFNNYNGTDGSEGALYKISSIGSYQYKYPSGNYKDIEACTFYDMYDSDSRSTWSNAICYIKATNMIFLNPDTMTSFGSMTMDNIEDDLATIISISDVTIEGSNVYRLQTKATYYGATASFVAGPYNYQLSTTDPFITSISLKADPAIIPANGVNLSAITAIVKDQFDNPVYPKLVYFTDDDPDGAIITPIVNTDANGVAQTNYQAGVTSREVKITATASQ